jgi:hypothetical protein
MLLTTRQLLLTPSIPAQYPLANTALSLLPLFDRPAQSNAILQDWIHLSLLVRLSRFLLPVSQHWLRDLALGISQFIF